ncbi:ABC transporter C family member 10-like [Dorcoceras hygrometricum]|uniref:ABC transporter C family member 10-like n=1 Tax=Dorcoceras hygrometricum TaxID=472368 RepID=A0A2Z7CXI3_9LAMI|nr:ABC transporter C family member 10-like [Dorcoceras hygrometricum]
MMNSRRICPTDGSQYKQSAVGLVFMESAAGLAMETSKVESAVRNQAKAKLNQLEHSHEEKPADAQDMKSAVMTSALMSSQSAVSFQQMKRSENMERRRVEGSADGLALMTSSMTSSYSADDLREQSQESAGSLYIQTQERSDVVEEEISLKLLFTSR